MKSFFIATHNLHRATQIAMEGSIWWWRLASLKKPSPTRLKCMVSCGLLQARHCDLGMDSLDSLPPLLAYSPSLWSLDDRRRQHKAEAQREEWRALEDSLKFLHMQPLFQVSWIFSTEINAGWFKVQEHYVFKLSNLSHHITLAICKLIFTLIKICVMSVL